jgi:hypothetical protein
MTTITKTITTNSGKKVDLTINIENAKVTGIASHNGQTWQVTGFAIVQGRQCLSIKNGPAPYLPIDNSLYGKIESMAKDQFFADTENAAWENVCKLEAAYRKLIDRSDSNADIIKAQHAYLTALNSFAVQYPLSPYNTSTRAHYNDGATNNPWTN